MMKFAVFVASLVALINLTEQCGHGPCRVHPSKDPCIADDKCSDNQQRCLKDKEQGIGCYHVCAGFAGVACPKNLTCCFFWEHAYHITDDPKIADGQGICL